VSIVLGIFTVVEVSTTTAVVVVSIVSFPSVDTGGNLIGPIVGISDELVSGSGASDAVFAVIRKI
jgi:hypothetical protein